MKRIQTWFNYNNHEGGFDDGKKMRLPYCPNGCWMTRHGKRQRKRCIVAKDPHDKELVHLQCFRCKGTVATAWVVRFR